MAARWMHRVVGWSLLKPAVFVAAVLPFAWCASQVWLAATGQPNHLSADPARAIVAFCGQWTFNLLLATLAVTPLRQVLGIPQLARIRRMLGLFTFFYASVHVTAYLYFLLEFRWADLAADVLKRPYITVGSVAFLLLVPLALTSNNASIRRLKRKWAALHSVIYGVGALAAIHVLWIAKSDYSVAAAYVAAVVLLLGFRFARSRRRAPRVDQAGPAAFADGATQGRF